MNVLAVRLPLETVRTCLGHTTGHWHVASSHQVHRACELVRAGDVDFVVANATLRSWDLHVIREVTGRQATELLVLQETRWPDDLARWLEQARLRRVRHLRLAPPKKARPRELIVLADLLAPRARDV